MSYWNPYSILQQLYGWPLFRCICSSAKPFVVRLKSHFLTNGNVQPLCSSLLFYYHLLMISPNDTHDGLTRLLRLTFSCPLSLYTFYFPFCLDNMFVLWCYSLWLSNYKIYMIFKKWMLIKTLAWKSKLSMYTYAHFVGVNILEIAQLKIFFIIVAKSVYTLVWAIISCAKDFHIQIVVWDWVASLYAKC